MKKKIVLILAALMCVSLCACGGSETSNNENVSNENVSNENVSNENVSNENVSNENASDENVSNENASNENASNENEQTEEKSILTEYNGEPAIEMECFGELLEVIELTTENWREHFKIVTYEEDIVSYDAFGELIKDENGNVAHTYYPHIKLVANTDGYFYFDNVAIELAKNGTDELVIYEIWGEGTEMVESINLDDYYCTRVIGSIILVNLPEEAVCTPLEEWNYECGFRLVTPGMCKPYRINQYTKGIGRNDNSSWIEIYIEK